MYSFKGWQNNKNHAFPSKRCICNKKNVLLLHILQWKSYIRTCTQPFNRKFYLLKNIFAYCGYSPTSPFFLLLSEHKHCDNTATNSTARTLEAGWWQVCGETLVWGQRKMSQVLGAFGLLDHITAHSRLVCILKFMNCYFLNFPNFFRPQ